MSRSSTVYGGQHDQIPNVLHSNCLCMRHLFVADEIWDFMPERAGTMNEAPWSRTLRTPLVYLVQQHQFIHEHTHGRDCITYVSSQVLGDRTRLRRSAVNADGIIRTSKRPSIPTPMTVICPTCGDIRVS